MSRHLFNDRSLWQKGEKTQTKKSTIGRANKLIDGCRSEMEMPLQLAEFSGVRMAWQYWHSCDHNGILWAVHWDTSYVCTRSHRCKVAGVLHWFDFIELGNSERAQLGNKSKTSSKFVSPQRPKQHLGISASASASIASYVIILLSTFDYY